MAPPRNQSSTPWFEGIRPVRMEARAAERVGLLHLKGHPLEKRDIATPGVILVDADGIVRWVFKPRNYRMRADLNTIIEIARSLPESPKG